MSQAPASTVPPKLGSLAHDARCVPLLMRAPETEWVMVESPQGVGWANSRYLSPQSAAECTRD